jgi:hypothetical protein
MADPVTPPPAGQGAADPGTANNDPVVPEAISIEDFRKLEKTVNSLAAVLRKSNQAPSNPAPTPAPTQTPASDDDGEQPKTLKELRAAIAKEREEARKEREEARKEREENERLKKENGIRDAIRTNGVPDEAADFLYDHLIQRHGSKISLNKGAVILTDELEETTGISDFIAGFLKTPQGKLFKPEKGPGPNTRAGRGGSAPIPGQKEVMEMSRDELLALKPEERRARFAEAAKRQ